MKFLRMAADCKNNITMSVYEIDDKVCVRKSHQGTETMYKQYQSLNDALKVFDKEVVNDYRNRGIYYDNFYSED